MDSSCEFELQYTLTTELIPALLFKEIILSGFPKKKIVKNQ